MPCRLYLLIVCRTVDRNRFRRCSSDICRHVHVTILHDITFLHSSPVNLKNSQSLTDLPKSLADGNMKPASVAAGPMTTNGMCVISSPVKIALSSTLDGFSSRQLIDIYIQGSKLTLLLRRQLATKGKNLVARS